MNELCLFTDAVAVGCAFAVLYDILLILRNVFEHSDAVTNFEDAAFWVITSLAIFRILYEVNAGVVRWFFVAGAALGIYLYKATISKFLVNIMSTILRFLVKILLKPFMWLFAGAKKLCKVLKNIMLTLKKRLTVCIKSVKINLCKHKKNEREEN